MTEFSFIVPETGYAPDSGTYFVHAAAQVACGLVMPENRKQYYDWKGNPKQPEEKSSSKAHFSAPLLICQSTVEQAKSSFIQVL